MYREIGIDFNGPIRDERYPQLVALAACTDLIIPADKFRGKATLKQGTLFETQDGDERALTDQDWKRMNDYIYQDRARYLELFRPTFEVRESLQMLATCGYKIRIISNIRSLDERFVGECMRAHDLYYHEITVTHGAPKTAYYRTCDAIVENQLYHLLPIRPESHQLILMDGDETENLPSGIVTTNGWSETLIHLMSG